MKRILHALQNRFVLLLFSAFLSALPMTVPSLFFLSWFSFVPFFVVLGSAGGEGKFRSALGRGVFFGFFYHIFIYFWFWWLYPLEFTGMEKSAALGVVLLAWCGISLVHGALYAIPTVLCHFFARFVKSRPFLLCVGAFGILASQRMTELSQLAFPWVRVSLGQYRAPALIQSASLFGMEGLDLLILSVNVLLALLLFYKAKKRLLCASFAVALFLSNLAFGFVSLARANKGETVTVSSVQGCILSGEKWNGAQTAFDTYVSMTRECPDETELVVWPESAVPVNLATDPSLVSFYQELSEEVDSSILMGCFWKEQGITTNSAILLSPEAVSEPYHKKILVPFGERMPYRKWLSRLVPALGQINMLKNDLAPGTSTSLMDYSDRRIGAVICFDSIFPSVVRQSAKDGAELFVIVTNDSWYEDSPAVWQHLAHAVFRSVENGRSTVRCANSGVSAFIDEKGRVQSQLGPLEKGVLTDSVSFCENKTLYTAVGNVCFPVFGAALALWFCILAGREGLLCRKKKN